MKIGAVDFYASEHILLAINEILLYSDRQNRSYDRKFRSNDTLRRSVQMLEPILGSLSCESVLVFILSNKEGYAREVARFFDTDLDPIQKQLEKLEVGGVLSSRTAGRTRLYSFNPRYPCLKELRSLLEKALSFYSKEEREQLVMSRRRPRRRGKPL